MNIFKKLAKGIGKAAKGLGKAAPSLITHAVGLGSGSAVSMVAEALGLGGASPRVVLDRIQQDPDKSVDLLIELENNKAERFKAIIDDRKDARGSYKAMVGSGDPFLPYFLPLITIIIFALLGWFFYHVTSDGAKLPQAANLIIGSIMAASTQALNFWFGQGQKNQEQMHKSENSAREFF